MAKKKTTMRDEDRLVFNGPDRGWMIATPDGKPLLHDGRMPIYWRRDVARLHLRLWMAEMGCTVVRVAVVAQRRRKAR